MADEQLELSFPDPSEFPSYDDVESDEGQAELPDDGFDEAAATEDELDDAACGCTK